MKELVLEFSRATFIPPLVLLLHHLYLFPALHLHLYEGGNVDSGTSILTGVVVSHFISRSSPPPPPPPPPHLHQHNCIPPLCSYPFNV